MYKKTGYIGMTGKHHSEKTKEKLRKKAKLRVGKLASNWKGGKMMVGGYIYIYSKHHPQAVKDGYVCEHRLVMEKYLQRFLLPKEVVHHLDGNKQNNKIENLELISSTGKHYIQHHVKRNKKGRFCK